MARTKISARTAGVLPKLSKAALKKAKAAEDLKKREKRKREEKEKRVVARRAQKEMKKANACCKSACGVCVCVCVCVCVLPVCCPDVCVCYLFVAQIRSTRVCLCAYVCVCVCVLPVCCPDPLDAAQEGREEGQREREGVPGASHRARPLSARGERHLLVPLHAEGN